jgi:L-arabinose isomerase
MDFMNLSQAAHGDREAGFIHTRLRLNRKVVVGHWSDPEVQERIAAWMRVARAWSDWRGAEFARFADNVRYRQSSQGGQGPEAPAEAARGPGHLGVSA